MSPLYVVSTPIGNLEDITLRALRVLKEADLIACEDTRRTGKLLHHFGIEKKLVSYHSHNQTRALGPLLELLAQGRKLALVSDGGTPGISDPGALLVNLAREADVPVVPVPGPSALAALVSVAGAPVSGMSFGGFLSPKGGRRRKRLLSLLSRDGGLLLFESPHRILKLLEDLRLLAPERRILLGREMTKLHEEFLEGTADQLLTELSQRARMIGEFTLYVHPDKKVQVDLGA
jgi:16S rRNA (cytidine1402-2'-O)-methyltransferase